MPGETYTLAESVQDDDWVARVVGCNVEYTKLDDGVGVTFVADPGTSISCEFENTARPEIGGVKVAAGGDGEFEFILEGPGGSSKQVATSNGEGAFSWGPAGLEPGATYTLTETEDTLWLQQFVECNVPSEALEDGVGVTFVAEPGVEVSCEFKNSKRPEITVEKIAIGGDGEFEFELVGPGGGVVDAATTDGDGSHTWGPVGLVPGETYTLVETVQDDWASRFVSCNVDATPLARGVGVTVVAEAGMVIACEFKNSKRPEITVEKTAVGGDGEFEFTLAAEGLDGLVTDLATTNGAGSYTWGPEGLIPGATYTLTETIDDAWVSTFVACDEGTEVVGSTANSVTFVAEAGATVSCEFENVKRPEITVNKLTQGGEGTFQSTLTGPGGSVVPVATTAGSGTYTWGPAGLVPGETYTLTETPDARWRPTCLGCSVEVLASTPNSVTFVAAAGDVVQCGFHNLKISEEVAGNLPATR